MAYLFQTFNYLQVFTSVQASQLEENILKHEHGVTANCQALSLYATLSENEIVVGQWTFNNMIVGNSSNNLVLSSNSAGGEISFWNNQGGTRLMTILGNGRVGIGTNSPACRFQVDSPEGVNSTEHIAEIRNLDTTAGQSHGLRIVAGVGATDSSFSIMKSNLTTYLFQMDGDGDITLGGSPPGNTSAKIIFYKSNSARNWKISTNDTMASSLEFTPSTAAGGGTFTTPLMSLYEGVVNIGMGNAVGNYRLNVRASGNHNIGWDNSSYLLGILGYGSDTNRGKITLNSGGVAKTTISAEATGVAPITVDSTTVCTNLNADMVDGLHTTVIQIGDWDMDATAGITVAHGLTLSKIRHISAIVYADAGGAIYDFNGFNGETNSLYADATNVALDRATTPGYFDNTGFNQTSFNRGWITIQHIP